MQKEFVVGLIRSPHGVLGMCKVESTSGKYEHIVSLKEVVLRCKTQTETLKIEKVDFAGSCALVKFCGIDSLEAIRKYKDWELVVPREAARTLEKDEWFIEDIKQCSLVYEVPVNQQINKKVNQGTVLFSEGANANVSTSAKSVFSTELCKVGTITDVLEGGQSFLFEVLLSEDCTILKDSVKYTSDGKIRTVYVPFVTEHIGKIDISSKTVQLMHLWILE
ncbi:MAG: 16S rRNA processing protein RimM [Treponema sp.]|nr:16S rRNA processing protein RimM [Treponema sp.]